MKVVELEMALKNGWYMYVWRGSGRAYWRVSCLPPE